MKPDSENMRCIKGLVSGRVQGVGFRYFVLREAEAAGLSGYVCNLSDGRVEFLLQGSRDAVTRVIDQIQVGPRYSQVLDVSLENLPRVESVSDFRIR